MVVSSRRCSFIIIIIIIKYMIVEFYEE